MSIATDYITVHEVRTDELELAAVMDVFSDLLLPCFQASDENQHGVQYHLPTEGPAVFASAKRLNKDQLSIA